jgi:hypothetical protein
MPAAQQPGLVAAPETLGIIHLGGRGIRLKEVGTRPEILCSIYNDASRRTMLSRFMRQAKLTGVKQAIPGIDCRLLREPK